MKILLINPHDSPDYLYRSIIEGLIKCNVELYLTNPDRLCTNVVNDDEAIRISTDVDFIFTFWDKEKLWLRPQPKFYLLDKINLPEKTVYIDGSEYNWTGYPGRVNENLRPEMLQKCKYYFKRECLPDHIIRGIIPLPFASIDANFNNLPYAEKDIDVLCAFGQIRTGQREIAVQACEELKSEGYNIINHSVPNYNECMNRAKITIDAHGGGECNARTFQVMANKSLLFMERYNIVIPNLIDTEHYVSWDSGGDLKNKIRKYLDNTDKIRILTNNSYDNVLNYHTSEKRVDYILKIITNETRL
jgi:hypothetical protein